MSVKALVNYGLSSSSYSGSTMSSDFPVRLVLASSSRYRKELLSRLGLPFTTASPDIDETPLPGEKPAETASRLAFLKAAAVSARYPDAIVIGSDQVAELQGNPIGKPGSFEKAFEQLKSMRGRAVLFHTALCVRDGRDALPDDTAQSETVKTTVVFRNLPDDDLKAYLKTEEPYDCAGSAKNEALGIILLEKIESDDPTALTGLPLITLTTMLRRCGVSFFPSMSR